MKNHDTAATTLYNLWQKKRRRRRRLVIFLLIICGLVWWLHPRLLEILGQNKSQSKGTEQTSGTLPKETPDYKTILPEGRSIDSLGGWARVSPPGRENVFAYADKIGKISITVSEQLLPDSFKADSASSVEKLAKSYSATRFITAGKARVYIGSSAGGPQSLIFLKNDLLILIKSSAEIPDDTWTGYIESMH